MMTEDQDCTGTARGLHEASEFDLLENDYSQETAICVTTKAIQRNFPDITSSDVLGFVKVNRALRSGKVDIAEERERAEEMAKVAATQWVNALAVSPEDVTP